jgi:hypothetical protein
MKANQENQDKILKQIGIKREMDNIPNSSKLVRYLTDEYRNSDRRETDEVYNMFVLNLLHIPSGLRVTLTKQEGYMGNVLYKVINIFIHTSTKKELEVFDADFTKKHS